MENAISLTIVRQGLEEQARKLGFDLFGVVEAHPSPQFDFLCEWLDRGYAGSMSYFQKRLEAYRHPSSVLAGCRSVVMLAMRYTKPRHYGNSDYRLASYACGVVDYHDLIHERLHALCDFLSKALPQSQQRGVVDTAPLMERDFARLAGLGWIGKNTLLLNRNMGSHFFLAALLTNLSLTADETFLKDHCGTCTACIEACPTEAFPAPRILDASRCISYLTIEHRDVIAPELCEKIGDWLFGCDICQAVCPWNRKSENEVLKDLEPSDTLVNQPLEYWLTLDAASFRALYRHTPLWRTKLVGIQRNAMIVAANTNRKDLISILNQYRVHDNHVLRETCHWALARLS